MLKHRSLYDPDAPNASTGIINGTSSNILNWDDTRFPWAYGLYKSMLANFWTPFEINMASDIRDYNHVLSNKERETFNKIIGLLAFLDSVQTDYAHRIANYLTDSSLSALMTVLAFQEVVHNQSYSYVLSSVTTKEQQDAIFEYWKHDPFLRERNDFIVEGYQGFVDEPTPKTFLQSIVYDVILEGLNFYSGFAFFYNMARNQKMVSTSTMINYINRDEHQHVRLFTEIFKETRKECPEFDTEELKQFTIESFRKAAALEIKWGNYIMGRSSAGLDMDDLRNYIYFMANVQVKKLGYQEKPFPEAPTTNPLRWIKAYQDVNEGKSDFFEQKSRSYAKVTDDNGFDEL